MKKVLSLLFSLAVLSCYAQPTYILQPGYRDFFNKIKIDSVCISCPSGDFPSYVFQVNGSPIALAFEEDNDMIWNNLFYKPPVSYSGTSSLSMKLDPTTSQMSWGKIKKVDLDDLTAYQLVFGDVTGNGQAQQSDLLTFTPLTAYLYLNGSLGIGISSPLEQLHITGNFRFPSTTSTTGIFYKDTERVLHFFGTNNLFIGQSAGNLTTSGIGSNIGVGRGAGGGLSTGYDNVFIGSNAGRNMSTGELNVAIGSAAMYSTGGVHTAKWNVAVGYTALYNISSGQSNVALGLQAGIGVTTGSNNLLIGESTYQNLTTGSNNIIIGQNIDAPASSTSNIINIGNTIYGENVTDKVGIGGNTLTSLFNVGSADQFQVNSSGLMVYYGGSSPTQGDILMGTSVNTIVQGDLIGTGGITVTKTVDGEITIDGGAVGGTYTDEMAQDAVGSIVSSPLVYSDGTPSLTFDITGLSSETSIDVDDDKLLMYDNSEGANNKITIEELLNEYAASYRKHSFNYYNEFINGVGTATGGNDIVSVSSGTGAASTGTTSTNATNTVGLVTSTTGTTATGRTSLSTYTSAIAIGGGPTVYEYRINGINSLSDGTNRYALVVGFFDTQSAANQVDGIYFLYDEGGVSTGSAASANWQTVTVSNSNRTFNTTSTAVVTTGTTLRIEVDASGTNVDYYIDGVITATSHTTNIPTGTARAVGFGMLLIKSIGTTARIMNTDYMSVNILYTTPKN
jgi:hypothetical protein